MARRVNVLLFKSEKSEADTIDPYRQAFEASKLSCTVYFSPVLGFEFKPSGLDKLRGLVASTDRCAIAVTSPRASEALASILRSSDSGSSGRLHVYCVGAETSKVLTGLDVNVDGTGAGSAKALGQMIVESGEKKVLFLCGDKRRDDLPQVLAENGVECKEVEVYRSVLLRNVAVPEGFVEGGEGCTGDQWCAFFSPSGVECISRSAKFLEILGSKKVKVAAIGQTSAAAVRKNEELGSLLHAVASKPNAMSLVQSIEDYYNRQCR